MSVLEIVLIVIGLVLFVGSFFIAEKLSSSDVKKVAELSESELKVVIESELNEAKAKISEIVDDTVDLSINKIKRDLDKETTDKLMAIGEYSSETEKVLSKANKEATFLYSMLNDKREEIGECLDRLDELMAEYKELQNNVPELNKASIKAKKAAAEVEAAMSTVMNVKEASVTVEEDVAEPVKDIEETDTNEMAQALLHNNSNSDNTEPKGEIDQRLEIYELYANGTPIVEIARQLKLGIGEVDLIIKLHKADVEAVTDNLNNKAVAEQDRKTSIRRNSRTKKTEVVDEA